MEEIGFDSEKKELLDWILGLSDSELIDELLNIKESHKEAATLTESERKKALEGILDSENNDRYSHSYVRELYAKYL